MLNSDGKNLGYPVDMVNLSIDGFISIYGYNRIPILYQLVILVGSRTASWNLLDLEMYEMKQLSQGGVNCPARWVSGPLPVVNGIRTPLSRGPPCSWGELNLHFGSWKNCVKLPTKNIRFVQDSVVCLRKPFFWCPSQRNGFVPQNQLVQHHSICVHIFFGSGFLGVFLGGIFSTWTNTCLSCSVLKVILAGPTLGSD